MSKGSVRGRTSYSFPALATLGMIIGVALLMALPTGAASVPAQSPPASAAPLSSLSWTNLTANLTVSPPPMNGQQMAYDPAVHGVILFGGFNGGGYASTWEFSNGSWTQLAPAHHPPSANLGMMAYDSSDHYLLLFGGNTPAGSNVNSTWIYRNGDWSALHPALRPAGRDNAVLAYDPADSRLVLFGGNARGPTFGDTWTFHAGVWTNLTANLSTSPSPRWGSAMAYDPKLGGLVLFGGCVANGGPAGCQTTAHDLWEFKGGQWTNITRGGFVPAGRFGAGLTYDPSVGAMVLYGGSRASGSLLSGTWVLQGTHWIKIHPASGSPPPRIRVGMVYDPPDRETVVFAGDPSATAFVANYDDTWVLN
jgi:hypothetical protein